MAENNPKADRWIATSNDVTDAIRDLSEVDRCKLERFAWRMINAIPPHTRHGREADDLLQQARTATIEGAETQGQKGRCWNKQVTFYNHLCGAMKSLANRWRNEASRVEVLVPSQGEDSERVSDAITSAASSSPDAERSLSDCEQIARIRDRFAGDDHVQLLIDGLSNEMKPAEIKKEFGMSDDEFDAARQRLSRGTRKGKQ